MIASITSSLRFFARNLWCGRKLQAIPPTRFGAFIIEPLSAKKLTAARDLYLMLNPGARLGIAQMLILRLLGPRLCLIARPAGDRHAGIAAQAPGRGPQNPAVAAVTLFYFNPRDRNEGTIHAAYNGLHPSAQGAGLGTFLLRHALENFARLGLAGAS